MKSNKECPKSARNSVAAGKRKVTAVKSEEGGRGREEEPGWPGAQYSDTSGALRWYGSRPHGARCTTLSCSPPACSHLFPGFITGNCMIGKSHFSLTFLCYLFTLLYPLSELKYFLLTKPCRWLFLYLLDIPSHGWCNASPTPNKEIETCTPCNMHIWQEPSEANLQPQILSGRDTIILRLHNSCMMEPYHSYKKNTEANSDQERGYKNRRV